MLNLKLLDLQLEMTKTRVKIELDEIDEEDEIDELEEEEEEEDEVEEVKVIDEPLC
jgi:hypothetical protein